MRTSGISIDLATTASYLREWLRPLWRTQHLHHTYRAYRHRGLGAYVRSGGLLLMSLVLFMTLASSWLYYPQLDTVEAQRWLFGCILVNLMTAIPVLMVQWRRWRRHYDLVAVPFATIITVKLAVMPQLFAHPGASQAESYFCFLAVVLITLALRLGIFAIAAYLSLSSLLTVGLLAAVLPLDSIAWDRLFFYLFAVSAVCMKVAMLHDASQAQTFILSGVIEEKNRELSRLADEDSLTGLANRRAFDTAIKHQWLASKRQRTAVAALFIDVDHFKRFNDHYGHDAGDLCLRQVAGAISSALLRESDLAARYGGEEFVILLADISERGALDVAERILARVDALALPHAGIGTSTTVTVSIGVALANPADCAAEDGYRQLLRQADRALYQAKHAGRHQVAVATATNEDNDAAIDVDQEPPQGSELV